MRDKDGVTFQKSGNFYGVIKMEDLQRSTSEEKTLMRTGNIPVE